MALTDNPFLGMPIEDIQALRATYLQVITDIAKTGKSYAFPGLSLTRADLKDIKETLSQLRIAEGIADGSVKQVAYATINTMCKFSGQSDTPIQSP